MSSDTPRGDEQFLRTSEPRECPACWGNGYTAGDSETDKVPCSICAETGKVLPYFAASEAQEGYTVNCWQAARSRSALIAALEQFTADFRGAVSFKFDQIGREMAELTIQRIEAIYAASQPNAAPQGATTRDRPETDPKVELPAVAAPNDEGVGLVNPFTGIGSATGANACLPRSDDKRGNADLLDLVAHFRNAMHRAVALDENPNSGDQRLREAWAVAERYQADLVSGITTLIAASATQDSNDSLDGRRYRWLQSQGCGNADEDCYLQLNPRDLDAAIDAAIAATQSEAKR